MNRFDQYSPTQFAKPWELPFNELNAALASKQKAQDEDTKLADEESTVLNSLQDGRHSEGWSDQIRADYLPQLQELHKLDLTSREGSDRLSQILNKVRGDQRIHGLIHDVANTDALNKLMEKDPNRKLAFYDDIDPNTGHPTQYSMDATGIGQIKNFDPYQNITPYGDYIKQIDEAGKLIKPNVIAKLKQEGRQVETDPTTGKEFIVNNSLKTKKQWIDETLPQWQAASKSLAQEFQSGSTPEAAYFRKKFANEISSDPNFTTNLLNQRLGIQNYKQTDVDEISKVGGGSGKSSKTPDIGNAHVMTQVGKTFPELSTGVLPENLIKDLVKQHQDKVATLKQTYPNIGTDNSGNDQIPILSSDTPSEINTKQKINGELAEQQQKITNIKEVHEALADKYGFSLDPAKGDLLSQVAQQNGDKFEKLLNIVDHFNKEEISHLPQVGQVVDHDIDGKALSKPYIQSQETFEQSSNEIKQRRIEDPSFLQNVGSISPQLKGYMKDLHEISQGVKLVGGLAYPLTKPEYKDVNANIAGVLSSVANLTGNGVQYIDSNKPITDEDQKIITKFLSGTSNVTDNTGNYSGTLSNLMGRTFTFWDRENGQYAAYVQIPRPKGDPINLKIGKELLPTLSTVAQDQDPVFNQAQRQDFRQNYSNYEDKTNNLHGLIQGTVLKIPTTNLPIDENLPNGVGLKKGDVIFTLPGVSYKDVVFRPNTFDQQLDFVTELEKEMIQPSTPPKNALDIAHENNIETITNPGLYKRYKKELR